MNSFANVGPNLATKIPTVNTSFKAFMSKAYYPVTDEEIEKELLGLDPDKTVSYGSLNLKVVREIAPYQAASNKYFLKIVFNDIFPDGLKISLITPVYKNEDKFCLQTTDL